MKIPLITAHAGAMHTKDNTLDSMKTGLESGADIVELDVCRAPDGEYVVTHDMPVRYKPGKVPYFEPFLKLLSEYPDKKLNIDLKMPMDVTGIEELCKKCGVTDQVFFTGVGDSILPCVRQASGVIPYYYNTGDTGDVPALIKRILDAGAIGLNCEKGAVNKEITAELQKAGLLVSIWTVGYHTDPEPYILYGPDNLTTLDPVRALKAIKERNAR